MKYEHAPNTIDLLYTYPLAPNTSSRLPDSFVELAWSGLLLEDSITGTAGASGRVTPQLSLPLIQASNLANPPPADGQFVYRCYTTISCIVSVV